MGVCVCILFLFFVFFPLLQRKVFSNKFMHPKENVQGRHCQGQGAVEEMSGRVREVRPSQSTECAFSFFQNNNARCDISILVGGKSFVCVCVCVCVCQ